ncbi:hypothetical protein MC75_001825 [Klebsiella pneumoniae]|uniref:hypothetical protein n=1 Tax=Klebsiella pneumoniae TaxID=573 RepID=UPI00053913BE|nr:hypothetical protein [Klebsiella pneumoniae]PNO82894.1 hypothetical protein MC75_001825 [Klebsiella pneumoniae]
MATTDTQQTAQFAAQAAVSAAEAKQYLLSIEAPLIDIKDSVEEAQNAARAAELSKEQAEAISVGLEEKIDAQLSEQATEFESQMTEQQSSFISQLNQQEHEFDAQLTSQESRYEAVLQAAGKTVLGRYEDGPWTLTSYNQLISYGGTFWKLAASVVIGSGYTTAGTTESTWNATDKANFVDVGQDQLRSELGAIFMPGPSGNATTDVQLLKSALNVGGFINYNVPGKYLYNDSGVIKSGTSLHTSAGADWHQDVNSAQWHPFLINNAYYASRFLVTSMTKLAGYTNPWRDNAATNGTVFARVVCNSHPFKAGDYAAFYGAAEFGYDGIMFVTEVVSSNEFIIESHSSLRDAQATSAGWAGGIYCFVPDKDIDINLQGKVDASYGAMVNPQQSSFPAIHTMGIVLHGIVNSRLEAANVWGCRKYGVLMANIRNIYVPRINFNTYSDGLHIMPPYVATNVGVLTGSTGDDMFALTGGDYAAYEISRGHGYSIEVGSIESQNSLTCLKMTGNAPYKFWDTEIGRMAGSTVLHAISLTRDTNLTYTDIGRLKIGSMNVKSQTDSELWIRCDNADSIIIDECGLMENPTGRRFALVGGTTRHKVNIGTLEIKKIREMVPNPGRQLVYGLYGSRIENLKLGLENINPTDQAFGAYISSPGFSDANGTMDAGAVGNLHVSGKLTNPGSAGRLIAQSGNIDKIFLSSLDVTKGENILHQATNESGVLEITKPTEVYAEGLSLTEITRAIRALGQVDVFMGANKLNVASTTPPLLADASTAVLTINGNVVTNASAVATKSSSAAKVYGNNTALKGDVVNVFNGRVGDLIYNVNIDYQYGTGLMRYNGKEWVKCWEGREVQSPQDTTATGYKPIWSYGRTFKIPSLTQSVTFYADSNSIAGLAVGDRVVFSITQDATGGRNVSWDSAFKFPVAWSNTGNTAGKTTSIEFMFDGTYFWATMANAWV